MTPRLRSLRALTAAIAVWLALASATAAIEVDLELVIAADVSRSMDEVELGMQRDGYVAAFTHPSVIKAIRSGAIGAIAVTYVEWAGPEYHKILAPWTLVRDQASAAAFAAELAAAPQMASNWTAVGAAIDFGAALFGKGGFQGLRRVIDVSGDGRTNRGRPAADARDDAVRDGVTINGLPVVTGRENFGRPPEYDLPEYYATHVIGGPRSFMIVARGFEAFAQAILSKLLLEIAGEVPSQSVATGGRGAW
jgi:hypothetical protein